MTAGDKREDWEPSEIEKQVLAQWDRDPGDTILDALIRVYQLGRSSMKA